MKITEIAKKATAINLIEIKDGSPVAITEYHDKYIEALDEHKNESIENDLDVKIVEDKIKEAKGTTNGLKSYRLGFTNPLKEITSMFTSREKKTDSIIAEWEAHRDTMLETTFKVAEEAILGELNRLNEENINLGIDMNVFKSFIKVQRKVKGMLPNDKGVLSKASLTKIETAFNEVANPIREAKAKEEQIAREQEQFEKYLPNTELDTKEALEAVLVTLAQQKEDVERLYPSIADMAHRTLDNKVNTVKANIRGIEANNARVQAESKAKEEKEVDAPLLAEVEDIKNAIDGKGELWLNEKMERLRVIYKSLTFANNQKIVQWAADIIKISLDNIKINEAVSSSVNKVVTSKPELIVVNFKATGTLEAIKGLKEFCQNNDIKLKSIKG